MLEVDVLNLVFEQSKKKKITKHLTQEVLA